MKRKFTKLLAALGLLVFMMPSLVAWGQTRNQITWDASQQGYSNQQNVTSVSFDDNISATFEGGKYYNTGTAIRVYGGKTFTITAGTSCTISSINITFGSGDGSNAITTDVGSYENGAWTGSASSIQFTVAGSSGHRRLKVFSVTYTVSGGTPTCATPTFNPAAGLYTTAQNVTISTETSGATIRYTTDGTDPTESSSVYSAPISVSANTTIKAMATATGYNTSSIATANYYFVEHAGTDTDPYSVADARSAIDAGSGVTDVYATGIVSEIVTAFNQEYGNISYNISTDGTTTAAQLQAYRGKSFNGAGFTSANDIVIGDVVVIKGNLTKHNDIYEFAQDNQLVSQTHPTNPYITADDVNITNDATSGNILYMVENQVTGGVLTATTESDWLTLPTTFASPIQFTCTANNATTERTATVVLTYTYNRATVTKNVIVTQAAYVAPHVTWDLSIDQTATATDAEMTWTSAYATMGVEKGTATTNTNNYYPGTSGQSYTSTRFYKNSVLTVAPTTGYLITSVVFEATTNNYAKALKNSSWTNATASMEEGETVTTVTVTPTNGASSMQATIGATCGFTEVKVFYETYVAPSYDLVVTLSDHIEGIFIFDVNDETNALIEDGAAGTVQVAVGTNIEVSPVVASGYLLQSLTVDGADVTSQMENGAYIFTMPSRTVNISATSIAYHKIYFFVNGEVLPEMNVVQGNALGTLPVPTEYIPAGFTFVGWTESPTHPYYNANTPPTMVTAATVPSEDMMLEAVFCIGETVPGTYQLSNAAPSDEEQVVLAVNVGGTYYAMNGPAVEQLNVSSNTISGTPDAVFVAEAVGNCIALKKGSQYIHLNSNAIKIANEQTNGLLDFTQSGIGYLVSTTVIVNEVEVTRYIKYDTDKFTVTTDQSEASTLYLFKYTPGATTNKDYTTSVVYHANNTTIAETAAEILYGIHFINGYVLAGEEVTNNGKLVINENGFLDMDDHDLNNNTAANLIIKDGAQLKTQNAVEGTVEKNITGYNTSEGGYYLIAAPGEIDITGNANNGFLPADHSEVDFYMFDQTQEGEEWQNMKSGSNEITGPLGLTRGTGYLYANKNNTTLVFNTMTWVDMYSHSFNSPFVPTNNNQDISVTYSTNGEKFAGWNLIGNPFTCKAYLADGSDFYRMNADGNGLIINTDAQGGGNAINVCEGIFVETTASKTSVTFTTTDPTVTSTGNNNGMVNISVAQVVNSRDAQPSADYARIRVNNGKDMTKFVFNENTSRVYIPQGNKDYAVVRSEARGEMPVNFKAAENGTYTISVEAENLDVNYLHLIDNITGMDVDLLATPSYTFEARKSDIASRFRLVFDANTGNDETNDNFAFINNGELIVNGNGTVQVIDILGRQMFSHEVNSSFRIQNSSFAPGVYVLRLVNGNDVKTQKIVIK